MSFESSSNVSGASSSHAKPSDALTYSQILKTTTLNIKSHKGNIGSILRNRTALSLGASLITLPLILPSVFFLLKGISSAKNNSSLSSRIKKFPDEIGDKKQCMNDLKTIVSKNGQRYELYKRVIEGKESPLTREDKAALHDKLLEIYEEAGSRGPLTNIDDLYDQKFIPIYNNAINFRMKGGEIFEDRWNKIWENTGTLFPYKLDNMNAVEAEKHLADDATAATLKYIASAETDSQKNPTEKLNAQLTKNLLKDPGINKSLKLAVAELYLASQGKGTGHVDFEAIDILKEQVANDIEKNTLQYLTEEAVRMMGRPPPEDRPAELETKWKRIQQLSQGKHTEIEPDWKNSVEAKKALADLASEVTLEHIESEQKKENPNQDDISVTDLESLRALLLDKSNPLSPDLKLALCEFYLASEGPDLETSFDFTKSDFEAFEALQKRTENDTGHMTALHNLLNKVLDQEGWVT